MLQKMYAVVAKLLLKWTEKLIPCILYELYKLKHGMSSCGLFAYSLCFTHFN